MIPRLTRRLCTLADPVPGAAWIPCAQLPSRLHELAPREVPVHLLGPGREFLMAGGRRLTDDPGEPGERLWSPNPMLEDDLGPLGHALDLGCGAGREAVWLALLGWRVTAIDRLADAVDRGRDLARRWNVADRIEWRVGEVDLDALPPADLTTVFRVPGLEPDPDGALRLEAFSDVHRARFGRPGRSLSEREARERWPGAAVEAAWRESGIHTIRVARGRRVP